jgi:transcription elongation factor Elf1
MSQRKHLPISRHQTLNGILEVNWLQDYKGEFVCPQCNQGRLTKAYFGHESSNGVRNWLLGCNSCGQYTYLSCETPTYIYNYQADLECPNPLCTGIGPRGQRGWIYKCNDLGYGRCRYCNTVFKSSATVQTSWQGRQKSQELLPFDFAANRWDLRHFYEQSLQPIPYSLMALNLIGSACRQNSIYTTYSKLKCILQHPKSVLSVRYAGTVGRST